MSSQDTAFPVERQPSIRLVAMPSDTNPNGDVFGGWIMSQVDVAGSIPAVEAAGGRVVTVAVNHFEFHRPVFVGDVVSFFAEVKGVGRTSITVEVQVFAQRYPTRRECVKVTEATLTYVAVDAEGRSRPVQGEA